MALASAVPPTATPEKPGLWARFAEALRTIGRGDEATRIRRFIGSGPGDRLLDVGGRTGAFTSRFANSGETVVILEPDVSAARIGKRRHLTYRFVVGRAENLPFSGGSFDGITAIRSTHHMEAPEEFFREARRVLSNRGRILIEERASASGTTRLVSAFAARRHLGRLDFRGAGDWERCIADAGFHEVVAMTGDRWYLVAGRQAGRHEGPLPA